MDAGTTFLLSAGDIHLWIIISDPKLDAQDVLIVNLTSLAPRKEQSCVLRVGDHPWIRHDTCVNYGDSKVTTLDKLVDARDANALMIQSPVRPDILQRIRESAMNSTKLPLDHAEILISQGLVQP
jgi:hypothetical protein